MFTTKHAGFLAALLMAVLQFAALGVQAQTGSVITGTITDADGAALAGATVTVGSPNLLGGPRSVVTNATGKYRVFTLPAGLYDLTVSGPLIQTVKRTALTVTIGTTVTVDIVVHTAASPPDSITDRRAGSVVDVTTPASTTRLSPDDLDNLPIPDMTALQQLAPGVTARTSFGSSFDANQVTLDGSPISYTPSGDTAQAHAYWLESAQFVGLGAGADAGDFSGVIANLALRSGTNRLSGLLEHQRQPRRWDADNTGSLPETLRRGFPPQEIVSVWASDSRVGGPIVRDRLFFFAGGHYGRSKTMQPGTIGDVPLDSRTPSGLVRLNWVAARNLQLDGFIQGSRVRSIGALARNALPETAGDATRSVRSWNLRATWMVDSSTSLELRNGGIHVESIGIPAARRAGPPPHFDRLTGISSGNAARFGDAVGTRMISAAGFTRFADGLWGTSHRMDGGAELERTTRYEVSGVPGGMSIRDANGVPDLVTVWAGNTIDLTGMRTTIYAQDAWSVTDRLSIHPGLRLSMNRGSTSDGRVVFRTNPLSPRIGVAWDLGADHRTVARASFARIPEALYTTTFEFMDTAGISPTIFGIFTPSGAFQETSRNAPTTAAIDDRLKHAYMDQFVAGIEREILADGSLTLQYVRRRFDDIWAGIDTVTRWVPGVPRTDPGPDGRLGTADDGGPVAIYVRLNPTALMNRVMSNPDGAFRRYDAAQAILQKRFARNWQLQASYTWSDTRGTVGNGAFDNRGAGQETAPGSTNGFFNPNAAVNAEGPSPFDFRHQLNVQGTYVVPRWSGASVSGSYRYLSGGAWARTAQVNFVNRVEPRGSRRVEGSDTLDLRVEKSFHLATAKSLSVFTDVFNAMNRGVPLGLQVVAASGDTFGQPMTWASPRVIQLAVRFRF